jgi:hypothetical protein
MILAMVGGEIGGGYDVELADRAEEEAGGKDDGEISESKANYGCERNIGERFGCSGVDFWRHRLLECVICSNAR